MKQGTVSPCLPKNPGEEVQNRLLKLEGFNTVAEIFRQLGDPTRVRIFWLLSHREACVMGISAVMNMSSPAVSHHLRSLSQCGLITSRREGKEVYYKSADREECLLLHETIEQIMEITCPEKTVDFYAAPEDVVRSVHDYLVNHLADRFTIEELAKQFLMNTTTLKKAFKAVYGMSIAAHMKEHRMDLAAKLLLRTGDSVAQIAQAVGYGSQSRFTMAFKESRGVVPTEYRKIHGLEIPPEDENSASPSE